MSSKFLNTVIRPGLAVLVASTVLILVSTTIPTLTNGITPLLINANGASKEDVGPLAETRYPASGSFPQASYRQRLADMTMSARIKYNFLWSAHMDGWSVNVSSQMGKVILTGLTDTSGNRDLAGWIAGSTRGVSEVDNQIVIADQSMSGGADGLASTQ